MKKIILGLVMCASSLAIAQDKGASNKMVVIQETDKYTVKYILEEVSNNWFWKKYNIVAGIYEPAEIKDDLPLPQSQIFQSKLIQRCVSTFACALGVTCPKDAQEWTDRLGYIDFYCDIAENVSLEDILPRKRAEEINKPFNY